MARACGICGRTPTRLYLAGHRCAAHTPARDARRPEPADHSTEAVPMDATAIAADLSAVITDAAVSAPRSLQVAIGPSEVGQECTRRLAYKLLDWPTVNTGFDPLPSWVGSGAHAMNAEAFERANAKEPGRWLVEQRVTVAPGLAGSCDLYDTRTETVIDHKFVGTGSMRKYRSGGPSAVYRTQVHLYALGWENAGRAPKNVAIAFFPRGGLLSGLHVWTEPYDQRPSPARRQLNEQSPAVRGDRTLSLGPPNPPTERSRP